MRLFHHRTGTAAVLVQQPGRRLPGLRRPRRAPVLRPGARGRPPRTEPGRRRGAWLGPAQCLLFPAHQLARGPLRFRYRNPVRGTAGKDPRHHPVRQQGRGDPLSLPERTARRRGAQAPVRGHHPEHEAALPRDRVEHGARGTGPLSQPPGLPGLCRGTAQPPGAPRIRGRSHAAGDHRPAGRRLSRPVRQAAARGPARRDRRQDPQGDQPAAGIPGQCRARLPVAGPQRRDAVGRRGTAHPARQPDRRRPGRRDVRARRAVHRAAPARQPAPARHPQPPARSRQHRHRRRTRRGGDPGR